RHPHSYPTRRSSDLTIRREKHRMNRLITFLANTQSQFINMARISILIVMVWIGGLKAFQYEADGIVPFVATSPIMSFFYTKEARSEEHTSELQSREK